MTFKSGQVHMVECDILRITKYGEVECKVTYSDGGHEWVVTAKGASLPDAQAQAYERFLKRSGLTAEQSVPAANHVQALYVSRAEREAKMARGNFVTSRMLAKPRPK